MKKMTDLEKKAKMTVLKDANSAARKAMQDSVSKYKDSKELKSHVKDMSEETGIDFKNDSDEIIDPTHNGNVVGRHISDENIDESVSDSEYNIDELEAQIKKLMEQKSKIKKG